MFALLLCRCECNSLPSSLAPLEAHGTSVEFVPFSAQDGGWISVLLVPEMCLLRRPARGSSTDAGWKAGYIVGEVYRPPAGIKTAARRSSLYSSFVHAAHARCLVGTNFS